MTKEIKQTKDIQTVIDELAIKGVEALNEMADLYTGASGPHCSPCSNRSA